MNKQRFIMANLIYMSPMTGNLFLNLWLENQLKSLMDKTNLPALRERYDLEYVLFTDDESLMAISRHPNFMALGALCEITVIKLNWPADSDRFGSRYGLLSQMCQQTLRAVFTEPAPGEVDRRNAWLGCWVADLVFAKGALPKMLKRLEAGHDAVFNVPIRSAADSVNHLLAQLPGAPSDLELFEMAYRNLHHLWTHSTWNNPYFTRMPYSMLWNSGTGLVAHNFGITPIVFKPSPEMQNMTGGIDSDLPGMCKNPFWATDWTDAPVAGVEPLSNGHYPSFDHRPASEDVVTHWALHGGRDGQPAVHPNQPAFLDKPLYYPNKAMFNNSDLAVRAVEIASSIQRRIAEAK